MNKGLILFLAPAILVMGFSGICAYGYWTDKLEVAVHANVLYPAEILEETEESEPETQWEETGNEEDTSNKKETGNEQETSNEQEESIIGKQGEHPWVTAADMSIMHGSYL
ncbi:hypothetical protein [Lacrimispora indolis]|uniref:hypothetical protein n=1 Tax=Lacrimispora indolis TaxID=69825 RepID=UPI00045E8AD7|nr:hypothetical protein [Lacrimispora indolis]